MNVYAWPPAGAVREKDGAMTMFKLLARLKIVFDGQSALTR